MSDIMSQPDIRVLYARQIPFEFAQDHLLLVTDEKREEGMIIGIICWTAGNSSQYAVDNLSILLGAPIDLVVRPEADVREAIRTAYQQRMADDGVIGADHKQGEETTTPGLVSIAESGGDEMDLGHELNRWADRDLLAQGDKAPVARLVDALLFDALDRRASDLHVHPYRDKLIIRYRVDGVLLDAYSLSNPQLHEQIVGRIKVLAGMDVAEKRLPQDGRTSVSVGSSRRLSRDKTSGGRQIDLRISTLPTTCGERVVVRLLEQTARLRGLVDLGMPHDIETSFQNAIRRSHGLILVTGPTGSGKTTTLYSALAQLDATRLNILTLEDPVEYQLQGVSQTQVATKKGMTFATALRHVLRQDPDVILVGEVRDEPTARMVIQSSMTGHLVITTLHTNTAASAIARLTDLGIEPFLITSCLIGVLAQRLVRKVCLDCANARPPCRSCGGSGYRGRTALFEWLELTADLREQVQRGAGAELIERFAVEHGMKTLWQQGREMVKQSVTTEAELRRVLGTNQEDQ